MNEDATNPSTAAIPSDPPTESVQVAGQVSTHSESPTGPIPAALQRTSTQESPYGLKKDGTPKKRHTGGKNGGILPGTPTKLKKTYNAEELANNIVPVILEGRSLKRHPSLRSISEDDRVHLQRITGESVEVFNDRIAQKLRDIADIAADRIKEHLEADNFKPGELGFIYSVAHDKRLTLDGSRALNNAAVNVTVNNFGASPKAALLSELDGMTNVTPKAV